jgi:hypothetical protein
MATPNNQRLYKELIASRMSFLPKGNHGLAAIYHAVARRYPHLCDDLYLCSKNCKGGNIQPEWKHVVRRVLGALKVLGASVKRGSTHGYWIRF